jgi:hypothetical protein
MFIEVFQDSGHESALHAAHVDAESSGPTFVAFSPGLMRFFETPFHRLTNRCSAATPRAYWEGADVRPFNA